MAEYFPDNSDQPLADEHGLPLENELQQYRDQIDAMLTDPHAVETHTRRASIGEVDMYSGRSRTMGEDDWEEDFTIAVSPEGISELLVAQIDEYGDWEIKVGHDEAEWDITDQQIANNLGKFIIGYAIDGLRASTQEGTQDGALQSSLTWRQGVLRAIIGAGEDTETIAEALIEASAGATDDMKDSAAILDMRLEMALADTTTEYDHQTVIELQKETGEDEITVTHSIHKDRQGGHSEPINWVTRTIEFYTPYDTQDGDEMIDMEAKASLVFNHHPLLGAPHPWIYYRSRPRDEPEQKTTIDIKHLSGQQISGIIAETNAAQAIDKPEEDLLDPDQMSKFFF